MTTSFNGGIDRPRAGKPIVGIFVCFSSVIFEWFNKTDILFGNILNHNVVCVFQLLLCCFCPFVLLFIDL